MHPDQQCYFSHDAYSIENSLWINTPFGSNARNTHFAIELLKDSFKNNGFIDYIKHPQKMVHYYVEHEPRQVELTPKIFHGLWLTNQANPRAISDENLTNFLKQTEKLEGYDTIFWTNIDKDRFLELNPALKSSKVTIKSLSDLTTEHTKLLDVIMSPALYLPADRIKYFGGVFVDLAKYLIMESQGGILADLNFKFSDKFRPENIDPYDFIASHSEYFNRIENGFFVAKPHHLIFKETLKIIEEMLFSSNCGNQILKNKLPDGFSVTEFFSMMPLMMAYI